MPMVKESEVVIIKVPIQRGKVACALNLELPEVFQQSSCTGHMREEVIEYVILWCMVL